MVVKSVLVILLSEIQETYEYQALKQNITKLFNFLSISHLWHNFYYFKINKDSKNVIICNKISLKQGCFRKDCCKNPQPDFYLLTAILSLESKFAALFS